VLKKTVTYTDPFEGNEVTEDLYFNLTKAEVAELALTKGESWTESLQRLSQTQDGEVIIREFKFLIGLAYGKREGNKHIKSPELTQEFLASEAYSELFMGLITSPDSGADFFNGILPKDLNEVAAAIPGSSAPAHTANNGEPAWIRENRAPTDAEMKNMTKAQMAEAFRRKLSN
jgi:hypothetical protein